MAQGTKIELATRYVSKIEPHTRVLPGAYYEIIDCSDESVLCSGCTQADGTAIVYPDRRGFNTI